MTSTQGTRQATETAIATALQSSGFVVDAYTEYDIPAIADAVYAAAGEWNTEALDHNTFWGLVGDHERAPGEYVEPLPYAVVTAEQSMWDSVPTSAPRFRQYDVAHRHTLTHGGAIVLVGAGNRNLGSVHA